MKISDEKQPLFHIYPARGYHRVNRTELLWVTLALAASCVFILVAFIRD